MAILALQSAASGLSALSTQLDVIANNLANANTTGFKSFRTNLEDLMYQEKQQPGIENAEGDKNPTGLFVGLGTRIANTQTDQTIGSPVQTGGAFDMMINGQGYFQVKILQQTGNGIGYARAGNFTPNANGQLVLGNSDGPLLQPEITIPQGATNPNITADGIINVTLPGQVNPSQVGQLQLATFVNPNGLTPVGNNIYIETAASGPPITGNPGTTNFGTILQGSLEASNVDPVNELVNLIKTQRSFEMNSQAVTAANQTLQVISSLHT